LVLRRGTYGRFHNFIITGFPKAAVDVRDVLSVEGTQTLPPRLTVDSSIFFNNGPGGLTPFPDEVGVPDNDGGFSENLFFTDAARNNRFQDPLLPSLSGVAPNFVPSPDSPAATGGAAPPFDGGGFFDSCAYVGAFEPGGDDWTAGWTSFPER
jgi:hypothetical protein